MLVCKLEKQGDAEMHRPFSMDNVGMYIAFDMSGVGDCGVKYG